MYSYMLREYYGTVYMKACIYFPDRLTKRNWHTKYIIVNYLVSYHAGVYLLHLHAEVAEYGKWAKTGFI